MALDSDTLLRHIDEAFGQMPYPGDEHIVYDDTPLDCEEIKEALKGRHWRDVPFETLDGLRSALPFLSDEGYRFYLPAYLRLSIVDFRRADVIPDSVISSLTIPPGLYRVSGFDISQSRVILEFLEYMRDVFGDKFPGGEPEDAIERYWYRFRDAKSAQ